MKRILLFGLACALVAMAQFGGLGKLKDQLEQAKQKAKPATDRTQKAAETFGQWSADEEAAIGDAGAAKMIAMFGLVENETVVRYTNLVGASVAQFSSRPMSYRFAVLDSDIAGAFALPGGYVFITRGALLAMKNEAQLAGVLGHEIVHSAERHLEKEVRARRTSAWAMQEGVAASKSQDLVKGRADALLKDLFNTSLSRDKEDAADEQGTLNAAKAGYAPAGLTEFLETLKGLAEKPENQQMFGQLLSTHPPFDSRIAKLRPVVARAGGPGQTLEERFQASLR